MRNSRTGLGRTPRVIREPEAGWWQAQEAVSRSPITVAVVREQEIGDDRGPVLSRLAAMAEDEQAELLVMTGQQAVLSGLRDRLATDHVAEVRIRAGEDEFRKGALVVERLLALGRLPVIVAPMPMLHRLAAEIASYLHADRVLSTGHGPELCEVWSRRPEPVLN